MAITKAWGRVIFLGCFAVFFATGLLITIHNENRARARLLKSPAFANGHFKKLIIGAKGSDQSTYYFLVSNDSFTDYNGDDRYKKLGRMLFDSVFPVIYEANHPQNSHILVFPDDFQKWKLPYPDRLVWVKEMLTGYE